MPLTRFVAVRHDPDGAGGFDQGNNAFSLFFRTIRPHRCDDVWQPVLNEPPDAGEAFEDDQIVNQRVDPKAVVKKQSLSEFEEFPISFAFAGEAFTQLFRCGECGGAITAEVQKGHIYYRCSKKNRATAWCQQPYVREEALDAEITALLKPFPLRADWADEMLARINEEKRHSAQAAMQLAVQKRTEVEKINLRLQKLLDSFLDELIDRETFTAEKAKLMSQKKTLEEQKAHLTAGRADWLELFKEWVLTAKQAGEIAVSGALQEKRVLALKVFGSNLVLDCKKARGSCVKPWSLLVEKSPCGGMVRAAGFEPATPSV